MQLSRQADYAIRAVLYLATSPLASVSEIAKAQSLPQDYLVKVLQTLSKAGLVKARRGIGGGISLTRSPEQITLLDVIEAVQGGPLGINRCFAVPNECPREVFCSVHDELEEIQDYVARRLSKINFAYLARKEKRRRASAVPLAT